MAYVLLSFWALLVFSFLFGRGVLGPVLCPHIVLFDLLLGCQFAVFVFCLCLCCMCCVLCVRLLSLSLSLFSMLFHVINA